MKIAISTDNGYVSAHFGRCPQFTMLTIENNQIVDRQTIPNPGHEPGYLPQFLAEKNVSAVIAGGAGRRAQNLFAEKNIQLVLGVTGSIDNAIELLCQGKLEGGESLCTGGLGLGDGSHDCDHGHH